MMEQKRGTQEASKQNHSVQNPSSVQKKVRKRGPSPGWAARISAFSREQPRGSSSDKANLQAVADCLKVPSRPGNHGVRAVINIPAVWVPSFCERSSEGRLPAYLNAYDREALGLVMGSKPEISRQRSVIDLWLTTLHDQEPSQIYFAAVELNGSGVGFFGDICLVLAPGQIPTGTAILDRNSYNLFQEPFWTEIAGGKTEREKKTALRNILGEISGTWGTDVGSMAAIKIVGSDAMRERRLTVGQISDGLLSDEDYMEVLKVGSFAVGDLEAGRLALADIVTEDQIERDYSNGQFAADHHHLLWAQQRRKAIAALRQAGVAVTSVRSSGRIKR